MGKVDEMNKIAENILENLEIIKEDVREIIAILRSKFKHLFNNINVIRKPF
jgi:hypothetical protein